MFLKSHYLIKTSILTFFPTVVLLSLVTIFSVFWLELVYDAEYTETADILRVCSVVYMVMFFAVPFRSGLRALERTKPILIANVYTGVFSIVCAMYLVSNFGESGTMFGILISSTILVAVFFVSYRSIVKTKI